MGTIVSETPAGVGRYKHPQQSRGFTNKLLEAAEGALMLPFKSAAARGGRSTPKVPLLGPLIFLLLARDMGAKSQVV
jgi:hypothetical protein